MFPFLDLGQPLVNELTLFAGRGHFRVVRNFDSRVFGSAGRALVEVHKGHKVITEALLQETLENGNDGLHVIDVGPMITNYGGESVVELGLDAFVATMRDDGLAELLGCISRWSNYISGLQMEVADAYVQAAVNDLLLFMQLQQGSGGLVALVLGRRDDCLSKLGSRILERLVRLLDFGLLRVEGAELVGTAPLLTGSKWKGC